MSRHNRETHRLGRNHSERLAMIENMVTSLLIHQEIKTTLQKAKVAQRLADRMITLGKTDTLAARRKAFATLQDHQLTSTLFKEIAPRFKNRVGGYTRILHLQRRKGDGAQLALLQLTEQEIKVKETKKKKKADKGHEGHSHAHGEKHEHDEPKAGDKETHKHPEKKEKPGNQPPGFFKNIGKFFKNKGGG